MEITVPPQARRTRELYHGTWDVISYQNLRDPLRKVRVEARQDRICQSRPGLQGARADRIRGEADGRRRTQESGRGERRPQTSHARPALPQGQLKTPPHPLRQVREAESMLIGTRSSRALHQITLIGYRANQGSDVTIGRFSSRLCAIRMRSNGSR